MSSVTASRRVAARVLERVLDGGAYADRALRAEAAGLEARDHAFAMQLSYGAIQRLRTVDHAIAEIGKRPPHRLDPPVRAALRLGAYQLGWLDAVPVHAAVNESVELVREAGLERAVAFTNAVLRRLVLHLDSLLDGLGEETPQAAGLRHSYPDWVAESWWRELGADGARALMRAQNEPAETALRVNGLRPGGPAPDPGLGLPSALVVERVEPAWLEQGLVWPQSRASQLAAECVGARAGEHVLDLCAAPGGKATQLAATVGAAPNGRVVAVEADAGRARELEANATRLGATAVEVVQADGRRLPDHLSGFDRVLVDAPCSGLGTLASRPDLRWRARPLPELQAELLAAGIARARPGATVTYAVCTINAAENEDVVDGCGLEVDDLGREWPGYRHPRRPEFLLTLPHRDRTSGFFIARLRVPAAACGRLAVGEAAAVAGS